MPRRTDKMSKHQITELSSRQKVEIDTYKIKWHSILIDNQIKPIQPEVACNSIESFYLTANFNKPQIIFFDNPFVAIKQLINTQDFRTVLGKQINTKLIKRIHTHNDNLVNRQLTEFLFNRLINQIIFVEYPRLSPNDCRFYFPANVLRYISEQLQKDFQKLGFAYVDLLYFTRSIFRPLSLVSDICRLDFCISCLNLQYDNNKWQVLQDLVLHSGLMFTFEKVCLVCDRPLKMVYSGNDFLRIDNEIEITYPGGYKISENI